MNDQQPVETLEFIAPEPAYVKSKAVAIALAYLALMAAALLLLTARFDGRLTVLVAVEALLAAAMAVNVSLSRAICRRRGYALRDNDISYSCGLIFPTVTTVPLCKIQQVSVRRTPVGRLYGLSSVDVINGSQDLSKQMTIAGLSPGEAARLRAVLIAKVSETAGCQTSSEAPADVSE